ncbi:hypothetical protein TBC1_1116 [Lentimicrobium saccharophilum]|uniref:Uncharacterized protein n=1 Tax=Lentimicrobium saccharophilum TaxID=1678841 RepID=A0A0S7BUX1_9BACT|nr:hypothetical protein TBC1_1116 [Lentimicrobium saccharophilum]
MKLKKIPYNILNIINLHNKSRKFQHIQTIVIKSTMGLFDQQIRKNYYQYSSYQQYLQFHHR